ncbi:hypothetical protein [Canibacter oris]|uniref:Uncharacterized protein n=1 Tax=Canibacter oris TaxID=1365628 RepID=A0A840DIP6_9MICO|nr:hypothetical protein [Canibacter oris]MBB4071593.1 hypothetical protein [Canibacter oris]
MARILITVKTSPQPSGSYGDTVCVAGVRLDTASPEWIRLYPVPFNYLPKALQFSKYDIVEVELGEPSNDLRPETRTPDLQKMIKIEHLKKWKSRWQLLQNLQEDSVCGLIAGATRDANAQSLGWVKPREVGMRFAVNEGWTQKELKKMELNTDRVTLPGMVIDRPTMARILEAPRFKVFYTFKCVEKECRGHKMQILDWELSELQRRSKHLSDEQLKQNIREKFLDQMHNSTRETRLFVGNIHNPAMRRSFCVLGVFYPPKKDIQQYLPDQNRLFDELL